MDSIPEGKKQGNGVLGKSTEKRITTLKAASLKLFKAGRQNEVIGSGLKGKQSRF